jgi:hypothetical protein
VSRVNDCLQIAFQSYSPITSLLTFVLRLLSFHPCLNFKTLRVSILESKLVQDAWLSSRTLTSCFVLPTIRMLKLHHMNLLNEIQETTLMMNLYQQQQLQQQQHQLQQQQASEGANEHMAMLLQQQSIGMDGMFGSGPMSTRGSLGMGVVPNVQQSSSPVPTKNTSSMTADKDPIDSTEVKSDEDTDDDDDDDDEIKKKEEQHKALQEQLKKLQEEIEQTKKETAKLKSAKSETEAGIESDDGEKRKLDDSMEDEGDTKAKSDDVKKVKKDDIKETSV